MRPTQIGDKFFHCISCGYEVLEEVMYDVVLTSTLEAIGADLTVEYSNTGDYDFSDGEVERVQCAKCGNVIAEGVDAVETTHTMMLDGDPNFREPQNIREYYPNLVCPTCESPISEEVEEGDECPACGHVFWANKT